MDGTARLRGKTVIVTGAGRGLGRTTALAFAREGATLAICSRGLAQIRSTAEEIRCLGGRCLARSLDISKPGEVRRFVETTIRQCGGVDVLVNNAAVQGPIGPVIQNDERSWVRALETNIFGAFFFMRNVLPHMLAQRTGKIINLSGGGATSSRPFFSAYAASKAALVRLTETVAEEVRDFNVQINAVAPGALNTQMQAEILAVADLAGEKAVKDASEAIRSDESAIQRAVHLILWLASSAPPSLTGKLIAARYDNWQSWDSARVEELVKGPWLTLRRIDEFTVNTVLTNESEI